MKVITNYIVNIPSQTSFNSKSHFKNTNLIYTTMQDEIMLSKTLQKIKKNKNKMSSFEFLKSISNEIKKITTSKNKNLIDNSLFGFKKIKESLYTNLVLPISKKTELQLNKYPASILFYGPNQNVDKIVKGLSDELSDKAIIINDSNISETDFELDILQIRDNAKKNLFETGKRTFVILNDVEKYFSITLNVAKQLGIPINNNDINIFDSAQNNASKIALFKSLLDNCSLLPHNHSGNFNEGQALTFIMTTKHPHLISPDLICKADRMTPYNLFYPKDNNLKDVITDIARKYNNDFLNTFDNDTWDILLKEINPSTKKGAISLDELEHSIKSFYKHSPEKNPIISNLDLGLCLLNCQRDIAPSEVRNVFKILKYLENIEEETIYEDYKKLIVKNELGLITAKDIQLLLQDKLQVESELKRIVKRENCRKLSDNMQTRKEILTQIMKIIEQENV